MLALARTYYRLASELAGAAASVSSVAFDVLAVAGARGHRHALRRASPDPGRPPVDGPSKCTTPSWTDVAPEELLAACAAEDVEGLVAKATSSGQHLAPLGGPTGVPAGGRSHRRPW